MNSNDGLTPALNLSLPEFERVVHLLAAIIHGYRRDYDEADVSDKMGVISISGPPIPCVYTERVVGGTEGGSSLGDPPHDIIPAPQVRPRIIYDLFKKIAPGASFVLYEEILSSYLTTSRTEDGYYSNRTEYEISYLPLSVLLGKLGRAGVLGITAGVSSRDTRPYLSLSDFGDISRQCLSELKHRTPEEWSTLGKNIPASIQSFWKEVIWIDREPSAHEHSAFGRTDLSGYFLPSGAVNESYLPLFISTLARETCPAGKISTDGAARLFPAKTICNFSKEKSFTQNYLDISTLYIAFLGRNWLPYRPHKS